jgi:hypothetical protein
MTTDPMNLISEISRYESGELTDDEIDALFQRLLDTGIIFCLQGSYQLTASNLIHLGRIHARTTTTTT